MRRCASTDAYVQVSIGTHKGKWTRCAFTLRAGVPSSELRGNSAAAQRAGKGSLRRDTQCDSEQPSQGSREDAEAAGRPTVPEAKAPRTPGHA